MPLRLIRRKGSPHWYVRGSYLGHRVFASTGTGRKPLARTKLREIEQRIEKGGGASAGTFSDAAAQYLKVCPARESKFVSRLLHHFRETPLSQIGTAEIEACAEELYPGGKPGTVNRNVLTPLAAILHRAAYLKLCPYIKIEKRKEPKGRDATLTVAQAQAVMDACSEKCRAITLFMLTTGARAGDAINLKWEDVDLNRAHVTLRDTKNGETYGVHLHPSVVAAMANLPKDRLNVFGYTYANRGRLNDDFRAACDKAEIPYGRYDGVTPHSLRHTFATWLRQKGWDLKAVQDLGRWKDIKSVARYAHVSSAEQKKAINGLPVQKTRNAKKRTAK